MRRGPGLYRAGLHLCARIWDGVKGLQTNLM